MIKIFKNRIIIFYLISVLFFYLIIFIFLNIYFKQKNIIFYRENLKLETDVITRVIENEKINPLKLDEISKKIFKDDRVRLTFIKKDGKVIVDSIVDIKDIDSMENHLKRKEVMDSLRNGEGFSIRYSTTAHKELIYYSAFKKIGNQDLIIRAAVDLSQFKNDLRAIRKEFSIFISGFLLFFALSGLFFIRKLTEPVDKIIEASKQYSKGNFSYKINIDFTGEMKKLAQTLNNMGEEIEKALKEIEYKNRILSLIFEGMKEGILILSAKEEIELFNRNFLKISTDLQYYFRYNLKILYL